MLKLIHETHSDIVKYKHLGHKNIFGASITNQIEDVRQLCQDFRNKSQGAGH